MDSSNGKTKHSLAQNLSSVASVLTGEGFWLTFLRAILIPIGVGVVAYYVIASLAEPSWVAPGWAYLNNYGKNVEVATFVGAFIAVVAACLLANIRFLNLVLFPVGLCGLLLALLNIHIPLSAMIPTGIFLFLVAALFLSLWEKEAYSPRHEERKSPRWAHALYLLGILSLAFLLNLKFMSWVDTYHGGALLYSSANLLKGEVPFETFYMFHGLHDPGIGALWIGITNKIGSSTLQLTKATNTALSAAGFYLLCFMAIRSARLALTSTLFVIVLEYVSALRPTDSLGDTLNAFNLLGPHASFQVWLPIIVGLLILTSGIRFRHFLTGFLAGFSHLWRFETGVYGFLALGGVLVYQDLVCMVQTGKIWVERIRTLLRHGALFVAGAASLFGLCYLILGWPNIYWWQGILKGYARYYRDMEGLPFPTIPSLDPVIRARFSSIAFGQLLLITILVIMSIRVLVRAVYPWNDKTSEVGKSHEPHNGEVLMFLALIGAFSSKTILSRSDISHLLQLTPILLSGVVLLMVASARHAFGWNRTITFFALAAAIFMVNPRTNEFRLSMPSVSWGSPLKPLQALKEHLSPNPPIGKCRDQTFTPSEALIPEIQEFIKATCDVERLFEENNVRNLIPVQAAAWYYVRFGTVPAPWKYNNLHHAKTSGQQLELVKQLRRNNLGALIRATNFHARESMDGVPSSITTPVVEAYLQERQRGVKPIETIIGRIYLFDNPRYRLQPLPSAPFRPLPHSVTEAGIHIVVDELLYTPAGFLIGRGWGMEWRGTWEGSPHLKRLFLYSGESLVGEIDYGKERLDVANSLNNPNPDLGWKFELVVPRPEKGWNDLGIRALTLDGRVTDMRLDTSSMRSLPRLRGREWDDLPETVAEARRIAQEIRFLDKGNN